MLETKRSRLRAKGRHQSRLDLVESILSDYHTTRASMDTIAQINKVSAGTVSKIVNQTCYVELISKTDDSLHQAVCRWNDNIKDVTCTVEGDCIYLEQAKKRYYEPK